MVENLFEDFKPSSAEEWKDKIETDLKSKPIEELNWNLLGLHGKPFYTKEDLPKNLEDFANVHQNPTAFGTRYWVNYESIDVQNESRANQQALNALNAGATGLLFQLASIPDFSRLLANVQVEFCTVSFQSEGLSCKEVLGAYANYLRSLGNLDHDKISGFIDAQGEVFDSGFPNLKTASIRSHSVSHIPLSIALTLADVIEVFNDLEKPEIGFRSLAIQTEIVKDYFLEIARNRALRMCLIKLASGYGLNLDHSDIQINSSTSSWEEKIEDPNSFILHATTQVMAAIVGGTDGLIVKPFHSVFQNNSEAAHRISRNVSNVLNEESYLSKQVDPAAGSYYLEHITHQITKEAFAILNEIEEQGGLKKIDQELFVERKMTQA